MDNAVAELVSTYRYSGLAGSALTSEQIMALERHLGLPLPAAYRAYLLLAGAYPPPELIGSDCHGHYLYSLRKWAEELLQECGHPFELPSDAVVFLMHQGYHFFYFRADGCDDDPPVYDYIEGTTAPKRQFERFSWWVAALVWAKRDGSP
jgi:hypothetical protein